MRFMNRQQISWWLWVVGTVLIALSWFNVVSTTIGWGGFLIGMVGSMSSWGVRPPPRTVAPPEHPPKPPDQGPVA